MTIKEKLQEAIALFEAGRKYSKSGTIKINLNEDGYDVVLSALREKLETPRDWTPCAEGLPTDSGVYGVTWKNLETDRDFASFGTFDAHMQRWDDQNERYVITAWMTKPDPYRADDTTGKVKEDA